LSKFRRVNKYSADRLQNNKFNFFSEESNHLIIGRITEIGDKEIRCHCGDCGCRFLAEELDFPNRIALCPNGHKTYFYNYSAIVLLVTKFRRFRTRCGVPDVHIPKDRQ
jgi:hypothetical protein